MEQTNAGNLEQTNMAQWQWFNNWQLNLTNRSMVERDVVLEGCRDTVLEVTDHWSVTDFLYLCSPPWDISDQSSCYKFDIEPL